MSSDAVSTSGVLQLPPELASVPAARAFARAQLTGCDPDLVDTAELCMSELATNGVVHARTEFEVRVEDLGGRIRLEIRDYSPAVPRHVVHSAGATTGRGLDMVRALSADWGVTLIENDGKVVWCELDPAMNVGYLDDDALLADWPEDLDLAGGQSSTAPTPPTTGADAAVAVLLNYPVRRGLRHREHIDGLIRECLLVQAARQEHGTAPGQLVELATEITQRYSAMLSDPERRKLEAFERGETSMTLHYPLPPETATVLAAYQTAFAALDAYAADHRLLTLQTPPDVAELREWVIDQFLAQAAGQPPTPWPGPAD